MGATSALILDFWGGGPAMVQILGCGMDTIMGHDQKRLPSRILAYSPQEDISSFFTLLASLYPNRFSTLGFLQATLSRESLLFTACPCQGRLFVFLFVSQPPKKLGAWGGRFGTRYWRQVVTCVLASCRLRCLLVSLVAAPDEHICSV